jgi:hypothetical protein
MTEPNQGPRTGGQAGTAERTAPDGVQAFAEPGRRARLLVNYNYDLAAELTQLLKGVWRMDQYSKDAGGKCDGCGKIWQDVRKQNELLIEKIRQEIVNHAKDGRFV